MRQRLYPSVVCALLFVVILEVKLLCIELHDIFEDHTPEFIHWHVVTSLVIDRQMDLGCFEVFLLRQADVIKVGILQCLFSSWALSWVELQHPPQQVNAY